MTVGNLGTRLVVLILQLLFRVASWYEIKLNSAVYGVTSTEFVQYFSLLLLLLLLLLLKLLYIIVVTIIIVIVIVIIIIMAVVKTYVRHKLYIDWGVKRGPNYVY